jgi:transposase
MKRARENYPGEFRPIPSAPGYLASDDGRIVNGAKLEPASLSPSGTGAIRIRRGKRKRGKERALRYLKAHRVKDRLLVCVLVDEVYKHRQVADLIMEAWDGEHPVGMKAIYLDGDPSNTRPENLQWTRWSPTLSPAWREAVKDAGHRRRSIDYDQVRRDYSQGLSVTEIATKMGRSVASIQRVVGTKRPAPRIDRDEVLVQLAHGGKTRAELARELEIGLSSLYRIISEARKSTTGAAETAAVKFRGDQVPTAIQQDTPTAILTSEPIAQHSPTRRVASDNASTGTAVGGPVPAICRDEICRKFSRLHDTNGGQKLPPVPLPNRSIGKVRALLLQWAAAALCPIDVCKPRLTSFLGRHKV